MTKYDWRIEGAILPETAEYQRELQVDYICQSTMGIVATGNELSMNDGGSDEAIYQFQEHEFRKLTNQYQYIEEQGKWAPSVAP